MLLGLACAGLGNPFRRQTERILLAALANETCTHQILDGIGKGFAARILVANAAYQLGLADFRHAKGVLLAQALEHDVSGPPGCLAGSPSSGHGRGEGLGSLGRLASGLLGCFGNLVFLGDGGLGHGGSRTGRR